jgi:hypothetical protein
MNNVLPQQPGLVVNGIIYRYSVEKNPLDPFKVHVQNENVDGTGYVFRETDDWSGLPGATINKLRGLDNIPREAFGDGSIQTEGFGTVEDPNVVYTYKIDGCFIPLSDPSCPGYLDALYKWLKDNGFLDRELQPGDPYYDEWVQASLNRRVDVEDEENETRLEEEEQEEDEDRGIRALVGQADLERLTNGINQDSIIAQIAELPNFDSYYRVDIQGGVYDETIVLQDSVLPDNGRAMRSLASDQIHRDMVRSQYDR